ncbi:MAG: hypothetical protein K6E42_07010 [Synergistes sp.]|jgi:hypothetical protein|nr:hypothetical protein [Synergistes sp.]
MTWFILILIIGTLVFGIAFPAMILLAAFVGVFLLVLLAYKFIKGGTTYIYTNRGPAGRQEDGRESAGYERRRIYTEEGPSGGSSAERSLNDAVNVAASEKDIEEAEEVIELPSSALRKDDDPAD